jgi:hypothetical protein
MQTIMPIRTDNTIVDHIFLISPQLLTQTLLGVDFCGIKTVIINFPEQCFTMERDGKVSRHHFAYNNNVRSINTSNLGPADRSTKTDIKSEQGAANLKTNRATADYPTYNLRKGAVSEVDMIRRSESEGNIKGYPFGEQANNDDDNCMMYDSKQVARCRLNACCSGEGISNDREGERTGEETLNNYDICTASRLGRYEERKVGDAEPATDAHSAITDDRAITKDLICKVINELENLTSNQKQKLSAVLMKYQGNLTKKPGKCKNFEYTFQVQGQLPKSTYSRPLPFALRPTVNQQIRQLSKDDILEESHSVYLNPLTVVQREGKNPRICVDARKINQITLPDLNLMVFPNLVSFP